MTRSLAIAAIALTVVFAGLPVTADDDLTDGGASGPEPSGSGLTVAELLERSQTLTLDHRDAMSRIAELDRLLPGTAEVTEPLVAEHYEQRAAQLDIDLYVATVELQSAAAAAAPDALDQAATWFDIAGGTTDAPPVPETLLTAPLDADPLAFANPATGDTVGIGTGLSQGGGYVCPVGGPVRFINDWGFPRSGGRTHKGLDMFASIGTPLLAPRDGVTNRITYTDTGLGGITVRMVDDDGIYWYLTHLSAVAPGVVPGQRVVAGQVLGATGNTGNARYTPPHLHAQRHQGGPSSPAAPLYEFMLAACQGNFSTAVQQG
jgi:murein DD-endopeptidase MepM/ murein hydrolase activator NlpD